jgi:uncharacterized repeat protein (TIGR02543 family)
MADMTDISQDDFVTLDLNGGAIVKAGFVFVGWNTLADGSGVFFDDGESFEFIWDSDLDLYAQWDVAVYYSIVYLLNGGVNAVGNLVSYCADDLPCSIDVPVRSGYSFVGWTVVYSNGQPGVAVPAAVYSIPVGTSGTVTLTAHWLRNDPVVTYASVTYDGNGFTGGSVPVDVNSPYVVGSSVTVLGQGSMVCEGYTFLGWALTSDADAAGYVPGSTFTILGDTVFFAVWEPVPSTFTVTYLPGAHGTFAEQVTSGLSYGVPTPGAPVAAGEAGWKFTGWSPVPAVTVTGDAVYTAQWEQVMLTVRFVDWNNVLLKEEQVAYGGSATAPANPTRTGYTFTGWSPAYNNIVSDLTVTAQYSQNGGGSTTTPSKPSPSPSPSPKPPTTTNPPPTETPPPPPTVTPPVDPETPIAVWALVNLILGAVGVV